MKRLLIICSILFSSQILLAQTNNAILFAENGEKFQVVLNGILQNSTPETNVKLTQLPAPNYKCRVIFAEKALGHLDFSLYFNEGNEELTMNIKQNKKGEYVTRYVSSIPIATAPASPASQKIIIYTTTPAPEETVSTTVSKTTTTHTTGTNPSGESINFQMGVNVNDEGGNISIIAAGMDIEDDLVSSSSTTTTTTTITKTTTKGPAVIGTSTNEDLRGYSGPVGCPHPMDIADFDMMKQTISSKDFESTRLSIAKQVLQENCLFASQVTEILTLFDFENTKLEFAKYAYGYTYDTGNYFKVNDAFEFESSIQDLNDYISSKN